MWLLRGAKFLELSGDLAMSTAHRFSGNFGNFLPRSVAHLLAATCEMGLRCLASAFLAPTLEVDLRCVARVLAAAEESTTLT